MNVAVALLTLALAAEPTPALRPQTTRAAVLLGVSGAAFIAGVSFLAASASQVALATQQPDRRDVLHGNAVNNRVGGFLFLATATLLVSLAAVVFWFEPDPPPITAALLPGGGVVMLGGSFR